MLTCQGGNWLFIKLLTTGPVVSWRGWETPPPQHNSSNVILCSTIVEWTTSLCVACLRWRFVYIWWMIGFFDADENEYYFLFILFVSYVIYIFTCPGVGYPYWFLGVAIGLELRIRLWHMFLIGLRRSGSVCLLLFTLTLFANFASTAPMSFRWLLRKSCLPGLSFVSLPSFRRVGCLWKVSGCPCVLPEGFPLLPLDLVQRGRGGGGGGESLVVRSVHASSLLSPRFIRGLWIQELLSYGKLLPFFFLSRLALPPHLCTLDEVMGWKNLRNVFSMFSVVSPASSLLVRRGGEAGETSKCRSS